MRTCRRNEMGGRSGLDPRAKLMMLLCLSGPAVFISDLRYLTALTAMSLLCAAAMRADFKRAAPFIKVTVTMMIPLFAVQCIFTRCGEPLISLRGHVLIMSGGVYAGALMALRILTVVTSALIVTTSPSGDYLLALVQCKMPYDLAFMIMSAMHFLPLLSSEAKDRLSAVQMKGIDLKNIPLRKKASVCLSLMLPILSGTLRRAESMSCAMQMRGFRAFPRRTYMRRLVLNAKDCAVLILCPAAAILFLLWEKGVL